MKSVILSRFVVLLELGVEDEDVLARKARQSVLADTAIEAIVAKAARQNVIAGESEEQIVGGRSREFVGAGCAVDAHALACRKVKRAKRRKLSRREGELVVRRVDDIDTLAGKCAELRHSESRERSAGVGQVHGIARIDAQPGRGESACLARIERQRIVARMENVDALRWRAR